MKKQIMRLVMLLMVAGCMEVFSSCIERVQEIVVHSTINTTTTILFPIDLGLSVKWAEKNIGAQKVTDYGDYYAWGETTQKLDKGYTWQTYNWCEGEGNLLTKYCTDSKYGKVDNKTALEPEDDAATANWGSKWRMPTSKEMKELNDSCCWVWTSNYDNSKVAGYIIYKAKSNIDKGVHIDSNTEVPNSNYTLSDTHIFWPAAGYYWGAKINDDGKKCYYLDSDLNTDNNDKSVTSVDRYYGQSVRAVYIE